MPFKDYTKATIFTQLFYAMGISTLPILPKVNFQRTIKKTIHKTVVDDNDKRLIDSLKSSSIEIKLDDVTADLNGLLEINGRKICIYIRDQKQSVNRYSKTSDYRYHLCECKTIQSMRDHGRIHRYLATKQDTGYFLVFDTSSGQPHQCNVKMELCKHCVEILIEKMKYKNPFNLHDYFQNNDSDTPKDIRYAEEVTEIQTYTPDFDDIAREYKAAVNYRCSLCNVDCSSNKSLIHLHHKDGNVINNSRENLLVLCIDCHSQQIRHAHMKRNPNYQDQISSVKLLRMQQKIY